MVIEKFLIMDLTYQLISDLRHENLTSIEDTAVRTIELAENIINNETWNNAEQLLMIIKKQMQEIAATLPQHTVPLNILRHVLKAVREEHDSKFKNKGEEKSLHNMVTADSNSSSGDYSKPLESLKTSLLDHLAEYKVEVESSLDNIAAQAIEQIHANEIILTLGYSKLVERFLKTAAQTRTFQVMVVEDAPNCNAEKLAQSLARSNIKTSFIPDDKVFAVMSRVNKVVIGTHTVMANGTLCAKSGTYSVGRFAKHFSVPVIVLTHLYQLSSRHTFPFNHDLSSMAINPEKVLPLSMGPLLSQIRVINPLFDKTPPNFVTLYITHQGGHAASYLYRLLTELFHPDDYDL